jgi:hypothetical protein
MMISVNSAAIAMKNSGRIGSLREMWHMIELFESSDYIFNTFEAPAFVLQGILFDFSGNSVHCMI